jgi:DNA repair protein RadC
MEESMKSVALNQIAEVELMYKSKVKASDRPKITHSKDAYIIFKNNWDENKIELQEQFKVMLLNRANKVLGIYEVSTGGMTGTVADPKLIFVAALKSGACSIMLVHNHPSGNLKPSRQDEELTYKIKEGGKLLDIVLLDHLIISNEGYFSMQDEGFI